MSLSRRSFIKRSLITGAVVAGAKGCGNDVDAAPIIDAEVNDDPTSPRYGQISIAVPMYPDLAAVGGAVTLRLGALPPGERPFHVPEKGVLLVHRGTPDDAPEFIATRADCPHQGCPLGYSAEDMLIECPCHGSRFRAITDVNDPAQCLGLVLHPPAGSNLTVYSVERAGDFVHVDLKSDLSCGAMKLPPVKGTMITMPISDFPALAQVGGSIVGRPDGLDDTIIVARVAEDRVICLSDICTHQLCAVQLNVSAGRMHCPCHGSEFSYDGAVLASPATAPLKKYDVNFDVDGMTVVISVV